MPSPLGEGGRGPARGRMKGSLAAGTREREAADILCEALDCECVQVIGRKFVLFKQKKKESAYTAVLAK